jgi:hypothetical protein
MSMGNKSKSNKSKDKSRQSRIPGRSFLIWLILPDFVGGLNDET